MKCTLTQGKQQKIHNLNKQNIQLEKQLQQVIKISMEVGLQEKQNERQITCLQILQQVQISKSIVISTSIANLQHQLVKISEQDSKNDEQLSNLQKQNRQLEQKMHQVRINKQVVDSMVSRLKIQIKNYQINGNITAKNCENLKKVNQCLVRTLAVLTNKLESHKKYLTIIENKKRKQICQQDGQIKNQQQKSTSHIQPKSYLYQKNDPLSNKLDIQSEQMDRKKMKEFDQMIRKKNEKLINNNAKS